MTPRYSAWQSPWLWCILGAFGLMLVLFGALPPRSLYIFAALPVGVFVWRRHRWAELRRFRAAHHLCTVCGYDLMGNASGVCPECGVPWEPLWLRLRREKRAEVAAAEAASARPVGRLQAIVRALTGWRLRLKPRRHQDTKAHKER